MVLLMIASFAVYSSFTACSAANCLNLAVSISALPFEIRESDDLLFRIDVFVDVTQYFRFDGFFGDDVDDRYRAALSEAMAAVDGLFARVWFPPVAQENLYVRALQVQSDPGDFRVCNQTAHGVVFLESMNDFGALFHRSAAVHDHVFELELLGT